MKYVDALNRVTFAELKRSFSKGSLASAGGATTVSARAASTAGMHTFSS